MHLSFSQTTNITKEQKKIIESFTAENYIEWSKAISNEKRQQVTIEGLEVKIDSLKSLYTLSYNNFNSLIAESKTLNDELVLKNKELIDNHKAKEDVLTSQLLKEKMKKWYVVIAAILSIIIIK